MKESVLILITSHIILEASNNSKSLSTYYVTDSVSTRKKIRPVLLSRSHMLSGIQSHHSSQDNMVNNTETVCVTLSFSVVSDSV